MKTKDDIVDEILKRLETECQKKGIPVGYDLEKMKAKAVKGGKKEGCYLGCMYLRGYKVTGNKETALNWFETAAKFGSVESKTIIKQMAYEGDPRGCFFLGTLYFQGIAYKPDFHKALKWFSKGADIGDLDCLCFIGYFRLHGLGFEKDESKGFQLIKESADKGSPRGQRILGFCYLNGDGCEKSVSTALEWYQKAIDQNDTDAILDLGQRYLQGSGYSRDVKTAEKLFEKGTYLGDYRCMYELAKCYNEGWGVEQNQEEAFNWFLNAAKLGHADAMIQTAHCYDRGRGVTQNYEEAFYWYKTAFELGVSIVWPSLANCYKYGIGTEINPKAVFRVYKLAYARCHDVAAGSLLEHCYRTGYGTKKDLEKADKIADELNELMAKARQYEVSAEHRYPLLDPEIKTDTEKSDFLPEYNEKQEKEKRKRSCDVVDLDMPEFPREDKLTFLFMLSIMADFFGSLETNRLIGSDYFEQLEFSIQNDKKLLSDLGVLNPATLQMMFYALMIVPGELLSDEENEKLNFEAHMKSTNFETYVENTLNPLIRRSVDRKGTYSTYLSDALPDGSPSLDTTDCYYHIRNAVSHSKCGYSYSKEKGLFVTFHDRNKGTSERAAVKMTWQKARWVLFDLKNYLMKYWDAFASKYIECEKNGDVSELKKASMFRHKKSDSGKSQRNDVQTAKQNKGRRKMPDSGEFVHTYNEKGLTMLLGFAMVDLMYTLDRNKFLESRYYEQFLFNDPDCKIYLDPDPDACELINEATVQMMLYISLVMPRALLSERDKKKLDGYMKQNLNLYRLKLIVEEGTDSTYRGEKHSLDKINYYKRIRNAVTHSRCIYSKEGDVDYVAFYDINDKPDKNGDYQKCVIKMAWEDLEPFFMELQQVQLRYLYNQRPKTEQG